MDGTRNATSERRAEEWRPGVAGLVGLLVLIPAGAFAGAWLLGDARGDGTMGAGRTLAVFLVLAGAWLVALPLSQYLLLRRAGARPRPGYPSFYPTPFVLLRAPGQPLPRGYFAAACALPALFAFVVLPVLAALLPGESLRGAGAGVLVGVAVGMSLYYLRYSLLALSRPSGTLVEEIAGEEGAVRLRRPGVRHQDP